ncbi:50S ribosomal protein L13 [Candidatus Woesearchaeota archaeon]|nr:MAG: 50S ribosomal protein L13 [Candidatus Woesearchaeota archaeon]
MEINIDATGTIAGRLATYAAKQALLGHTVNIFNSEKAIISGSPELVRKKYHYLRADMGKPQKGPFVSRLPDRFLRRMIRNMVGYKTPRGGEAFKRIMCYIGVPTQHQNKKLERVGKTAKELPTLRYQTIGELCRAIGGKV